MGQNQSADYIDAHDVNPRVDQPARFSTRSLDFDPRDVSMRRGHRNEDSEVYSYASSSGVERMDSLFDDMMGTGHKKSVSLTDDYSFPQDRLSSTRGDYSEPYLSETDNQQGAIPPPYEPVFPSDPAGIYALAKDVPESETSTQGTPLQPRGSVNQYDSLADGMSKANLKHKSGENYDHISSWSSKMNAAESSVTNKTASKGERYEDLPPNYEEPWDSLQGQRKLSRLMDKAERQDERRQSVDKANQNNNKTQSNPGKVQRKVHSNSEEAYETAWGGVCGGTAGKATGATSPTKTSGKPAIPPTPRPRMIQSNYEEAWDTPGMQLQFEEKLEKARLKRTSEGLLSPTENAQLTPLAEDTTSTQFSPPANVSPTRRKMRTEPDHVIRSDSVMSIGALAEKVDVTIPLKEQTFFHGRIKRSEAEKLLVVFKEGSYLVRQSETSRKDFSLTLKGWNGLPMHMKIQNREDGSFILGENSPPFSTIPEMVDYYTKHELPVQNAERICLLYPIPS